MGTQLHNALFWAHHIRRAFLPEIDAFARCLVDRLLPTFGKLEEEADRVQQAALARPCYSEDVDPADLFESAQDEALVFLDTMRGIEQGLINMSAAGLYHAFEQQLLVIHRRHLLDLHEESNPKLWRIEEVKRRLKDAGIDMEPFGSWPRIDE